MSNLVRAEWIKFRSVRSNLFVVAAAVGIMLLAAFLGARQHPPDGGAVCRPAPTADATTPTAADPNSAAACGPGNVLVSRPATTHLDDVTGGSVFAALLFAVLGVQIIGQEYRFSTIRTTFVATPRRWRVLVAKWLVATGVVTITMAATVSAAVVIGRTTAERFAMDGVDQRIAWGIVLFTVLWTTAAMGVGAIVRQPVAAIVAVIGEALVLESLLQSLVHGTERWVPWYNGLLMTAAPATDSNVRSTLSGGVYFAVVCLALWAVGAVLVQRRDA